MSWEIEELPPQNILTVEEQKCEDHFIKTHTRDENGRYIVRLPFRDNLIENLGNSLNTAIIMLNKIEQRLKKNFELQRDYYKFLTEYKELGHMIEIDQDVNNDDKNINSVYIPFFPIIRENSPTTRVRIVFNASSKTSSGTSLNDLLLTVLNYIMI